MGGRLTPAVKYTILFSAGICLQSIFNIPLIFAATGLAICIIAVFIFREKSGFLIVCILFSGLCRMAISDTFFHENENYVFTSDTLTAEVLSRKAGPFFIKSYVLNLSDSIHSVKAVCYSKVNLPELLPGRYYSIVNYRLEKIVSPVNPYGFNYHAYCKRKGISHRLLFGSRTIVSEISGIRPLRYAAFRTGEDISYRYLAVLGIEKGSLINGMLLGRKSEIPAYLSSMFRQLGISHLLAVSGLHVGLIVLVLSQFLSLSQLPKGLQSVSMIFFLIFYCYVTGGSSSVVRSSLMTSILLLAPLFRRQYTAFNAVCVSALILCLANPGNLMDTGFQFSYAAVLGILLLYQTLRPVFSFRNFGKAGQYIVDILLVSVCASLFTAPLSLIYFGSIPCAALLLNITVIPITFCCMICAIILLPFLYFPIMPGNMILASLDLILEIFRQCLEISSQSSFWTFHIPMCFRPLILAVLAGISIMILVKGKKIKICFIIVCLVLSGIWYYRISRPEIVKIASGSGKCILIRHRRNICMINTGTGNYYSNDYDKYIKPILDHWSARKINIFLTEESSSACGNIQRVQNDYLSADIFSTDASSEAITLNMTKKSSSGPPLCQVECRRTPPEQIIVRIKKCEPFEIGAGGQIIINKKIRRAEHYVKIGKKWCRIR